MRSAAIILVLASVLTASRAEARGSAQLVYTYPDGVRDCPSASAMRSLVASQLGYDPFDDTSATRVEASIERAADHLRGRVVFLRDGRKVGERSLDAANDCANVARALALTIAAAVDTFDPSEPASPNVSEEPPPASAPVRATTADDAPPAPSKPDEKSHERTDGPAALALRGSVAPIASLGIAPSIAPGVAFAIGVRSRAFSVEVGGRFDLPADAALSTGGTLRTSATLAMLIPCYRVRPIVACALVAFGSMRGESRDVLNPASNAGAFGAAGARFGVELPLSQAIAIVPEVDVLAAFLRPELQFDGLNVWTASPISGTLGAALVVEFGNAGSF